MMLKPAYEFGEGERERGGTAIVSPEGWRGFLRLALCLDTLTPQ